LVKGKICHKKDAGYRREFQPIIVHIVTRTQVKGNLIYSLNYLADVREKNGDDWSQEPRDTSGTEDSKGIRQILVIMQ